MGNFFRFFTKYLIPVFVTGVVSLAFDLYKNSAAASEFYTEIFDKYFSFKIWAWVCIFICYYLYIFLSDFYKSKIVNLEEMLNSEVHKLVLLHKQYDQYQKKDLIRNQLRMFINKHPHVQSIQIYDYSLTNIGDKTKLKVSYDDGYSAEGIEINAMDQAYYEIEKKMVMEFKKAKRDMDKYGHYHLMMNLIKKNVRELANIPIADITESHAIKYAFVNLGSEMIRKQYQVDVPQLFLDDEINAFEDKKRTGILRAIMLRDNYFMFHNRAVGMKHLRVYTARHMDLWGDLKIYLITFHPDSIADGIEECDIDAIDKGIMEILDNLQYNRTT